MMGSTSYNAKMASNPYAIAFFASIGRALFGFDISSMSGILNNESYLKQFNFPKPTVQGGIVASISVGSLVGALATSELEDRIGRKKAIIIAGWIWVIGSILQCASVNIGMLVVGRIISGIAVGISTAVVPVYLSEITAPAIRGRIVSISAWAISWGIFTQYFIQFGCSYIDGVASFRIPWGLQIIPAVILSVGISMFPESPRHLLYQGYDGEALQVLADLHGGGDKSNRLVLLEYEEIRQQVYLERTEGARSYMDLLKPGNPRRVMLGICSYMWSELTGIIIMVYYLIYVFDGAGLTGRRANLIADSIQYVLNVVFGVPALIYIDKWGRRPMLLVGTLLMCFWLFLVGGIQAQFGEWSDVRGSKVWIIAGNPAATKAVIVCSYLFVCTYAMTMGPVGTTYAVELYSFKIRGKAVSLATSVHWVLSAVFTFAIPPGLSSIAWKMYFIFGTFNIVAFLQVYFMFPETVGRSLEEIEEIFDQGHTFTAWKIGRDVGKKTLEEVVEKSKDLQITQVGAELLDEKNLSHHAG